jgi:ABC-type glycerol-3-phosphate transport system substrate-binding protein
MKRWTRAVVAMFILLALSGCGVNDLPVPLDVATPTPFAIESPATPPTPTPDPEAVHLRYAMWDANQVSAYAGCAEQFMLDYPHITITIEQTDETFYWDTLAAEMAAGSAPDVFVNQLTRLPDLAAAEELVDLEPLVQHDSMLNGLADSIWIGAAHPEAAWQWVKYLGSVECQLAVGELGVVFPALQSGVERMVDHYDQQDVNVRAFTNYLTNDADQTFFFPVTEHTHEIETIMQPVIEAIMRNAADPAVVLPEANERVNALFE